MCGRFTLATTEAALKQALPGLTIEHVLEPRYNLAPSQEVAAVLNDGQQALSKVRWGLIPAWAKESSIGTKLINARAETLLEKPSFQTPFRRQRCLVWATGFYEWKRTGLRKQPYLIRIPEGLFALAGLWDTWRSPQNEPMTTCTLITTEANAFMAPIHDRMPVILSPEAYTLWLAPGEQDLERLAACLRPYTAQMQAHPVALAVNNPRAEGKELSEPLDLDTAFG